VIIFTLALSKFGQLVDVLGLWRGVEILQIFYHYKATLNSGQKAHFPGRLHPIFSDKLLQFFEIVRFSFFKLNTIPASTNLNLV
jgi:hypothetical protein